MCGIFCKIGKIDAPALDASLQAILHRGPDNQSSWSNEQVYLGHTRLSIIDVSENGNQPVFSHCGRYVIVFNGEIYNYQSLSDQYLKERFPSINFNSDTRVLLYLYLLMGQDCVGLLNGMFAFAIVDLEAKTLFAARDRFGEKPLYYTQMDGSLLIGSELRLFEQAGLPLRINMDAVGYYTHVGSFPQPYTIYQEVWQLPAAHRLLVHYGDDIPRVQAPEQYWQLPAVGSRSNSSLSYASALEQVQAQFSESVLSRLVSDVPVGLFLSGGIDSAAVLSVLASAGKEIACITCDFEDQAYSEFERTQITARHFGYDVKAYRVSTTDFASLYPGFIEAMDQPTVDGMNNYLISSFAKQFGYKVWLNGTGGDELFGGYPSFTQMEGRLAWAQRLSWLNFSLKGLNKTGLSMKWARLLYLLFHPHHPLSKAYLSARAFLPPNCSLLQASFYNNSCTNHILQAPWLADQKPDGFQMASFYETRFYLTNQLLRDADNFSMRFSLELRAPFLDHKLYELVYPMPAAWKKGGQVKKPLLVNSLAKPLAPEILIQKKSGFGLPHKAYLLQNIDEVTDTLTDRSITIWDQSLMQKNIALFKQGRINHDLIWMPYILNNWLKNRNVNL
jgi:asparagine synthase (glutamine-hydrolysing)